MSKIIDWKKKGNVVRLYLGKDDLKEWYGDDWDDIPYEYNADAVYQEFVSEHIDIAVPFDYAVLEPQDGSWKYNGNSPYCKDDIRDKKVPMLIFVSSEITAERYGLVDYFDEYKGSMQDGVVQVYMGESFEDFVKKAGKFAMIIGEFEEV